MSLSWLLILYIMYGELHLLFKFLIIFNIILRFKIIIFCFWALLGSYRSQFAIFIFLSTQDHRNLGHFYYFQIYFLKVSFIIKMGLTPHFFLFVWFIRIIMNKFFCIWIHLFIIIYFIKIYHLNYLMLISALILIIAISFTEEIVLIL